MHIQKHELQQVVRIARAYLPPDTAVLAFGSRAHGRHLKPLSDLDLCLKRLGGKVPVATLLDLRRAFEDSDLPYRVDVIDFVSVDPGFRSAIEPDLTLLTQVENETRG